MDWSDIKDTVAKHAPLVGTLLGGVQGRVVGSLISNVLGTDNSPKAVIDALGDPEKQLELHRYELDNAHKLRELGLEQLKVELQDKQDARKHHKDSKMPAVITILLTLANIAYGIALFEYSIPPENRDLLTYFGGQLIALWVSSVVYWVGTSRSSQDKTKLLSKATM